MPQSDNYALFRDCFSSALLQRISLGTKVSKARRRRNTRTSKGAHRLAGSVTTSTEHGSTSEQQQQNQKQQQDDDDDDLADFIDYLASEIFSAFPADLQNLSYSATQEDPFLKDKYADLNLNLNTAEGETILNAIPPSVPDSISTYALLPPGTSFPPLLSAALTEYTAVATTPPPSLSGSSAKKRASACEICARDWVPLTYHHLIPKQVHEKALKRGWHEEWALQSVAWLCRACHSFVHRVCGNEELARDYWSVELLLGREDVERWRGWIGRVRWKAR